MPKGTAEKTRFTLAEAAKELSLPETEVQRFITEGKLGYTKNGDSIEISQENLDLFRQAFYSKPGASL